MGDFKQINDKWGFPYYTIDLKEMPKQVNLSTFSKDTSGLFSHRMNVSTHLRSRFNSDLTEDRDEVILAFLALILMFIIEAIVSAILLRTKGDIIGRFGFSVKLLIELIRDFDLHRILKPEFRKTQLGKGFNLKLMSIAILILIFTLGLEVGILFLTSREQIPVFNTERTFRLRQGLLSGYEEVRFHSRASLNRPCIATALLGVDGGRTQINGCVTSGITENEFDLFSKVSDSVRIEIVSQLHEFGAEHKVNIGEDSATYQARAFFSLDGDGEDSRVMREGRPSPNEKEQIHGIHKQYIAFLFSAYNDAVGDEDTSMNLTRLNGLKFNHTVLKENMNVSVIKIKEKEIIRKSRGYKTEVSGILPSGSPALRLAQDMFRGLTAIEVSEPDDKEDLFVQQGPTRKRGPVWQESGRVVNWLSMVIAVSGAFVLLIVMRIWLRSVGIADVAGGWVRKSVGANVAVRPIRFGDSVKSSFRVRNEEGDQPAVRERLFDGDPRYSDANYQ